MAFTIPRKTDSVLDRELTQLTRARDQYRAAFEEANDAILILNDEAQIIDANPEAGDLLGLEQRTLLGQSFQGFLLDTFDFDRAWNELQDAGSHRDYLTIVGCDGIEREVEYSATANIAPNQHLVVARDITERIERKRTLEETTRRLQAVIDASPDAILAVDAEGTIQLWNEAAEDVFGYETEAVIGERIQSLELYTEGQSTEFERKFERSLAGESFSELKLERRTRDGDPLYLSMSTAPIVDDSGTITGVMAVAKNVHTFREVVENTGSAIYWTDTDGTIEYVNPAFEAQTGYTADEAIGENACILQSGVYGEAFYERLWETILNGDVWEGQIINERKDGTRYTVKQTISPVTNEAGEIVRFVAVNEDITDLREAQTQLEEQRDNLETLSEVVRHDIRNDLQLVRASAELAVEHVDEEGREYLETVQESTASAVGLLRTARKLAELLLQTDVETRPIVLARPLEQQIDELRSLYPDAEIAVEGSLPRVRVVGNELLGSVFRNLLQNAIQHNDKEVPSITVTTTTAEDLVEIRIADNGPGVPDTQKGMIFGKDEGRLESEGAGIGLYLVRSLVESYDGDVWVEDNEPEGAVFVVHLPVAGSVTHD
ncbi:PAS domain-containing sensor histidine kinase [Halorubrum sp. 48-1-W]|uniref:PAS domain-containing sensor histidine kinase n=1 Tax=Halorubrum sp. 48-1-W TaxID=2249761 RepID=UPI0031B5E7B2